MENHEPQTQFKTTITPGLEENNSGRQLTMPAGPILLAQLEIHDHDWLVW